MTITEPTEATPDSHLVDIVAVHGLYEGALENWTDPETATPWLRDLFPHSRFGARVLSYGYNASAIASPGQGSADRIHPHAVSLVAELCADRQLVSGNAFTRPIIFVCRGIRGLLVKRALTFSSTRRSKALEHQRSIYLSTYAILFFGVPHAGISKSSLLLPLRKGDPGPSQFMINLLRGSEMLQEITDQFAPLMKQFSVFNFWEEIGSVSEGSKAYLVDEGSAAPAWDNVERCGISATHSGIVKYKGASDQGFRVVFEAFVRYIRLAPDIVRLRWTNDRKSLVAERQREAEDLIRPSFSADLSDESLAEDLNEWFVVPRCSTNYFTGRRIQAKALKERLKSKQHVLANQHRVYVIYGLGGSGKTQICLKFVEDNRLSYWSVFWIDASSEENAEACFASIGQEAGKGSNCAAAMHWLSKTSKPWLLVIDNADDPEMDVSKYFPAGGGGHIIVTTRNPSVNIYATVGQVRFTGMDPEEATSRLLLPKLVPRFVAISIQ